MAQRGIGFGIPSIRVDGNDVLAMLVATPRPWSAPRSQAAGPRLIEAVTYRMSLHTTADDPKVYREESKVQAWSCANPILRFEKYLVVRAGVLDQDAIDRVAAECEQEVLAGRERLLRRGPAPAALRGVQLHLREHARGSLAKQQREYFDRLDRKGVE